MHLLKTIKRLLAKIFGTRLDELFWEFRHFLDKKWSESYISNESLNHPHRQLLIDKISNNFPFQSVLEIGCASGPNLYLLSQRFLGAKFYGIDISKKAIKEGQKFFDQKRIKNVSLENGSIMNLGNFEDRSMDIVFSDAAILYIGPDKIKLVLAEMMRIAKKAVVLCEQHTDGDSFYNNKWVHNYKDIIKKIAPEAKINFTKIPEDIWAGDWAKYGYVIEIKL